MDQCLSEVLANEDIEHWVEAAVEEGQGSHEVIQDTQDFELSPEQQVSEPNCVQKGNQLKGEPTNKEGNHNSSENPRGTAGINHAFFRELDSNEPVADSDDGHWHSEANDKPDDPSSCQHGEGHLQPLLRGVSPRCKVESTVHIPIFMIYCSQEDENLRGKD